MKTRLHKIFILYFLLCISFPLYANPAEKPFAVRAFHLDFRTQVMSVFAIKKLAYDLSQKGINTLILEYEASFPFQKHATLRNKQAFTQAEVKDIVGYCNSLGIDVIPLQNCFGHCEYILRHERYALLREDSKEVSQVCPLKIEDAKAIFREIFQEVAALHPSPYFHIGADETYLLGSCRQCSKVDKSRLFVNYVKAMSDLVREMGKQPVIWADIILKHPEAIQELPKDIIYVDWNYGWEPDYFGKLDNLINLGVKMWGAPSLRSHPDNIYLTQWMKHFENLATFLPFARQQGYEGIIQTSWSTSGTYGFHYDTNWEITEMQPIRQVYPMSGFQILIDAFCQAADSPEPIHPETFIKNYAQERYGLSAKEASIFLHYFQMPQETIQQGKDTKGQPIATLIEECEKLKKDFSRLAPRTHTEEFEHYCLMLDLRINYLQFKEVEAAYESNNYEISQSGNLAERLKVIIADAKKLNQRFTTINRNYLKPCQAEEIIFSKDEKMQGLYETLQQQYKHLKEYSEHN